MKPKTKTRKWLIQATSLAPAPSTTRLDLPRMDPRIQSALSNGSSDILPISSRNLGSTPSSNPWSKSTRVLLSTCSLLFALGLRWLLRSLTMDQNPKLEVRLFLISWLMDNPPSSIEMVRGKVDILITSRSFIFSL